MTRAAIYARYSSDRQSETSIEDQQRLCADRAARDGLAIVATWADLEVSASIPMSMRTAGREMLAAVAAGEVDVVLIEALDRCWRDIVDQERTLRRVEALGVRVVGVSDGYDSRSESRELTRGVRGLVNQQYLRDLAAKTHRGLAGQFARGHHTGGLAYGYRTILDGDAGHRLEIDPAAADIVREIYTRTAAGESARAIVHDLNARGVPPPRKTRSRAAGWCVSALAGARNKGTGILNNATYTGRITWNRSRWLRDPDTGRRIRRERPPEEWRTADRPDLRIIEQSLWERVAERLRAPRPTAGRGRHAAPSTLFGGLLRCGTCGAPMVAIDARRYGCSVARDRGAALCAGTTAPRADTDRRLLASVRDEIAGPEAIAHVRARLRTLITAATRDDPARTRTERLRALGEQIRHLVDALAAAGPSLALTERLRALETERHQIEHTPTRAPADIDVDQLVAAYRAAIMDLHAATATDLPRARDLLGGIFGPIRIEQDVEGATWAAWADTAGRLLVAATGGPLLEGVAGTCYSAEKRIRIR